jgi:tripartite ATP-independent transporter DctP family solute receptor
MRNRAHRLTTAGAALTAAAVAAAALTACAPQETGTAGEPGDAIAPMTFTLGHSEASEGLPAEAAERYAELVNELTDGAVTIEIFPAGQLGSLYEMQETLEVGGIDIVMNSVGSLERYTDLAAIDGLPFLYDDEEQLAEVWNGEIGAEILDAIAEDSGFRLLGAMYRGPRVLNSTRPVENLDDLAGLKLRVPTQQTYIDTWVALGGSPAPMAFSEVFGSLESGAIDGQENPIDVVRNNSLYEIAPYITETNHIYGNFHMQFSEARYQGYPEAVREALEQAAAEVSEWYGEETSKRLSDDKKFLEEHGTEFFEVDLAKWRAKTADLVSQSDPRVQEWVEKIAALRS